MCDTNTPRRRTGPGRAPRVAGTQPEWSGRRQAL